MDQIRAKAGDQWAGAAITPPVGPGTRLLLCFFLF